MDTTPSPAPSRTSASWRTIPNQSEALLPPTARYRPPHYRRNPRLCNRGDTVTLGVPNSPRDGRGTLTQAGTGALHHRQLRQGLLRRLSTSCSPGNNCASQVPTTLQTSFISYSSVPTARLLSLTASPLRHSRPGITGDHDLDLTNGSGRLECNPSTSVTTIPQLHRRSNNSSDP